MILQNGERLFCWPLDEHIITAGWYYSDGSLHRAIDFRTSGIMPNPSGSIQPVKASEDGTVDQIQIWDGVTKTGMQSYGTMIRVKHADYKGKTLQTRYAHLSSITVGLKVGDSVKEGDIIGYTGSTGNVFGDHFHFEVIYNGSRVNPLNWLDANFVIASNQVKLGTYVSVIDVDQAIGKPYILGIDASRYQGEINWAKVKADGIRYAILRVGSSNNDGVYIDPYFETNYLGCLANGIAVGAYIFTYAENETEQNEEILKFLPVLEGKTFKYPVFVDVEYKGLASLGKSQLSSLIKRYMDILDQKGFFPGWYSYTNFINSYIDADALNDYPLWVADYRSSLGYTGKYDIWQYTSSGSVNGISGDVDMNRDYRGYIPFENEEETDIPDTPETPTEPTEPETPEEPTMQLLMIGPMTNAEAMEIYKKSMELKLPYMSKYTTDEENGQIVVIGPVSSGDAYAIWGMCKRMEIDYSSAWVET